MIRRSTKTGPQKISISLSGAVNKKWLADLEKFIQVCSKTYYTKGRFARINVHERYPLAVKLLHKQGVDVDAGVETIDDQTFDLLWEILTEVAPDSPVLKRTGVAVSGKTQVKLPYAMNGLSQVGPTDVDKWLAKHPGPYVVSDKMDGVSLETVHKKTGQVDAYTKGDSDLGNIVTPMISHMDIPLARMDLAVRAEMIMPESTFNRKHSRLTSKEDHGKKYENARNMVAGATNPKRKSIHPAIKDIHVVAYELLNPRKKPSEQLKLLSKLGYKVAPHKVFKTLTADKLLKHWDERRKATAYALDGLVIAQDKMYPIATNDEPAKHMVKFKFNSADSIVEVKVKDVIWEESKHGKLIPRVNIPPTRLSGVTVDFATGHNAYFIVNGFSKKDAKKGLPIRPVGPGATIRITRSGDVIPYIVEVVKGVKNPALPDEAFKWGPTGVHIFQAKKSALVKVKQNTYFFSKLKAEGIKQGMTQKLFDAGFDTVHKVVRITKRQLLGIEGIKEKTADKFLINLNDALKKMTLPALMDASGAFGQGMGEKRIGWALKVFPRLLEMKTNGLTDDIVENVDGFSHKLAKQLVDGIPKFNAFYAKLNIKAQEAKPVKQRGAAFKGKVVVWTGFRNAAQELKVVEQGGTVGSGVSSKTHILVVKDKSFSSAKVDKAKKLGLTILTNAELQSQLDKLK